MTLDVGSLGEEVGDDVPLPEGENVGDDDDDGDDGNDDDGDNYDDNGKIACPGVGGALRRLSCLVQMFVLLAKK